MATIFFSINLLFALHNIIRYLIRRKIGSKLTYIFYVFVIIHSGTHLMMYLHLACDPSRNPFMFDATTLTMVSILEWIGSTSMVCIGWLVAATMYQLTISVRQNFGLITATDARKQKRLVYNIIETFAGLSCLAIILIPLSIPDGNEVDCSSFIYVASYIILIIFYSIITHYLLVTLHQMRAFGNFTTQQWEIFRQFIVFLVAFSIKAT